MDRRHPDAPMIVPVLLEGPDLLICPVYEKSFRPFLENKVISADEVLGTVVSFGDNDLSQYGG